MFRSRGSLSEVNSDMLSCNKLLIDVISTDNNDIYFSEGNVSKCGWAGFEISELVLRWSRSHSVPSLCVCLGSSVV